MQKAHFKNAFFYLCTDFCIHINLHSCPLFRASQVCAQAQILRVKNHRFFTLLPLFPLFCTHFSCLSYQACASVHRHKLVCQKFVYDVIITTIVQKSIVINNSYLYLCDKAVTAKITLYILLRIT